MNKSELCNRKAATHKPTREAVRACSSARRTHILTPSYPSPSLSLFSTLIGAVSQRGEQANKGGNMKEGKQRRREDEGACL